MGLAASVRCQFRRVAAGPLAVDGSLGAAWTAWVRLACVSVTVSVRTWSELARACRPPRGAGLASLAATWRCDRLMHLPAGLIPVWFWQAALCMRTE